MSAEPADQHPAPSRRRRRSRQEVARLILDAARDAFERQGYSGATTAAIASAAGVTEAQLFRYHGSKAELFRAAVFEPLNASFRDFNARWLDRLPEQDSWRASSFRYITELQAFIGEHAPMLKTLVVSEAYDPQGARGVARMGALTEYFEIGADTLRAHTPGAQRVDPKLMVRVSFAAVLASVLFREWLFPDALAGDDDVAAALVDFVLDGISANHGNPTR